MYRGRSYEGGLSGRRRCGRLATAPVTASLVAFLRAGTLASPPSPPASPRSVVTQGNATRPGSPPSASHWARLSSRLGLGPSFASAPPVKVPAGHTSRFFFVGASTSSFAGLGRHLSPASPVARLGLFGSISADAGTLLRLIAGVRGVGPSGGSRSPPPLLCQSRKALARRTCFRRSLRGTPAKSLTHGGPPPGGPPPGGPPPGGPSPRSSGPSGSSLPSPSDSDSWPPTPHALLLRRLKNRAF